MTRRIIYDAKTMTNEEEMHARLMLAPHGDAETLHDVLIAVVAWLGSIEADLKRAEKRIAAIRKEVK